MDYLETTKFSVEYLLRFTSKSTH